MGFLDLHNPVLSSISSFKPEEENIENESETKHKNKEISSTTEEKEKESNLFTDFNLRFKLSTHLQPTYINFKNTARSLCVTGGSIFYLNEEGSELTEYWLQKYSTASAQQLELNSEHTYIQKNSLARNPEHSRTSVKALFFIGDTKLESHDHQRLFTHLYVDPIYENLYILRWDCELVQYDILQWRGDEGTYQVVSHLKFNGGGDGCVERVTQFCVVGVVAYVLTSLKRVWMYRDMHDHSSS